MKNLFVFLIISSILFFSCSKKEEPMKMGIIDAVTINKTTDTLLKKYGDKQKFRIETGVNQVAKFWTDADGSKGDFVRFCTANFAGTDEEAGKLFERLSTNYEVISGHMNKITLDLNMPLHLDIGEIMPIDEIFGAYSPGAHLTDDFFKNKVAFTVLLNFPHYSLVEKNKLGEKWTRKEWAYARMGDIYTARVPAEISQKISETQSASDNYIANYNIYAGYLLDDKGQTLFPEDLKLITHWNLRDEIKSQYGKSDGLPRQKMIYEVMKRIIAQEIPENVINKKDYKWNPVTNKIFKDGKEVASNPEPDTRYKMLLNNFLSVHSADPYCPYYKTYIERKFDEEMEMPQKQVEDLFVKLVSSPTVKKIGQLIQKRLGRNLEPFDIWYDGFKARSAISQDELDAATKSRYPNTEAFQKELTVILNKMGFSGELIQFISERVVVDPSRGAGHAWGAQMKSEKARLRTRIGKDGMDYKGYNIAVHEFGHNVEQTLTLHKVDYYMMSGVPNTAFTEAMAFIFQSRDLDLLGMKDNDPNKEYLAALDNFWMAYEIMGVSLVDQQVWKWLYENPDATPDMLKKQVITVAKDVWNKYFADVIGIKDQTILAIYSHMIDYPLYLSAYPVGHLIEFQVEKDMKAKNASVADEMYRILTQGRLVPDIWMKGAVGSPVSVDATIDAAEEALKHIN
jgi:hypothetical protein